MAIQADLKHRIQQLCRMEDITFELVKGTWPHIEKPKATASASELLNRQQHFQYHAAPAFKRDYNRQSNETKEALIAGTPLHWEGEPTTLVEAFHRTLKTSGNKKLHIHLQDGTIRCLTYNELNQLASRILQGLREHGLKPGDAVLLQVEQIDRFIALFWACILGGLLPAPLKPSLSQAPEHAEHKKVEQVWEVLDRPLVVCDPWLETRDPGVDHPSVILREGRMVTVDELLQLQQQAEPQHYAPAPEDGALYLFTSGTTGIPKCVRYRHTHVLANIIGIQQHLGLSGEGGEVTLNWMPLYHAGGLLTNHVLGVVLGSEQVLRPVEQFLDNPSTWLADIDAYRVTFTWAPNFAYVHINQMDETLEQGTWDLGSLRIILNVGQPISAETAKAFLRRLAPYGLSPNCIVPAYGMTEFSGSLCFNRRFSLQTESGVQYVLKDSLGNELSFLEEGASPDCAAFTEVGEVVPGIRLRIVDEDNRIMPEACIGKVQVQGSSIVDGYYKNVAATSTAFPEAGWLDTGDLGFIREGRLTLTGREKDLLIMNAKNVYNFEVESVMAQAYGVDPAYAAAAGISGGEAGNDDLLLFFSPPDEDMTLSVLIVQELRGLITRYFGVNPRYIVPVSRTQFPRTPTGKIQRLHLVNDLLSGQFDSILETVENRLQSRLELERQLSGLLPDSVPNHHPQQEELEPQALMVYYSSPRMDISEAALYADLRDSLNGWPDSFERVEIIRQFAEPAAGSAVSEEDEERQLFLSQCFQQLLGRSRISQYDDFFQLGGDSLRMVKLLTMIASRYRYSIPLRQFFDQPTIGGLLQALRHAESEAAPSTLTWWKPDSDNRHKARLPLTLKQKSQWILHILAPQSAFYTNTFTLRFQGDCDPVKLEDSLQVLMQRHEALRLQFTVEEGEPFQYIAASAVLPVREIDLRDMEPSARSAAEHELIHQEANRRFDLLNEPCLRLLMIVCSEQEHVLVVSMHHIMSDGWSSNLFASELLHIYERQLCGQEPNLPPLPASYSDYVLWQCSLEQDRSSQLWSKAEYWKQSLSEPLPLIEVPGDYSRQADKSYRGRTAKLIIDEHLTELVRETGRRSGVTLFMLLFAVYSYMIHRFTRQNVIPIGTVMANRTLPETEGMIGFLANTVVLCVQFDEQMTFGELLEQVKETVLDGCQHQEVPFEMVLPVLKERNAVAQGNSSLFQVMFTLQNEFTHRYQVEDTEVSLGIEAGDTAKYDLILHVYEQPGHLEIRLEYSTDLYTGETAERFLEFYKTILEGVVEH